MTVATKMADRKTSIVKKLVTLFKKKDKNKITDKDTDEVAKDRKSEKDNAKNVKKDCNKTVNNLLFLKSAKNDKEQVKVVEKDAKESKEATIQVDDLVENLVKLKVQKEKENELKQFTFSKKEEEDGEDDELSNFHFKIVEDDRRSERIDSQSSGDSGFAERDDVLPEEKDREDALREEKEGELDDVLVESLSCLKIDEERKSTEKKDDDDTSKTKPEEKESLPEKEEKKKKLHTVVVSRGPIRSKAHGRAVPYETGFEQISQVNRQCLSGGLVTLTTKLPDEVPDQVLNDYCGLVDDISAVLGDQNIDQPQPSLSEDFNYAFPNQNQHFENSSNEELLYGNLNTDFTQFDQFNGSATSPFNGFTINNTDLRSNIGVLQNNTQVPQKNTPISKDIGRADINSVVPTVEMGLPADKILPSGSFGNAFGRNQNASIIMTPVDNVDDIQDRVFDVVNQLLTPDQIESILSDNGKTPQSTQYENIQGFTSIAHEQFNELPPSLNPPSCFDERSTYTSNMSDASLSANEMPEFTQQDMTSITDCLNDFTDLALTNNTKIDTSNHSTDFEISNYTKIQNNTDFEWNVPNHSKIEDMPYLTDSSINVSTYPKADDIPYLTPPSSNRSPLSFHSPSYASSDFTSPLFYSPGYQKSPEYINSPPLNALSPGKTQTFQDIQPIDSPKDLNAKNIPNCSPGNEIQKKKIGMPDYKKFQKQLSEDFEKRDCCKKDCDRVSCKELFKEFSSRLQKEDRIRIGVSISSLSLKEIYGALLEAIEALSSTSEVEDKHHHTFSLLCQRLFEDSTIFTGNQGLCLLESAVVRCPHKPLITRYIVHCIRTAIAIRKMEFKEGEVVFNQRGERGDTLLTFCAKEPAKYSDVLAELLRRKDDDVPLFNINHRNADGYSALHIACREHKQESSALHTVHVLIKHGQADIYQGDSNGGETAVHFAVNSPTCDLDLVLLLFSAVDNKKRKQLATLPNMSSITPLQYARTAAASSSRKNYPKDVYNFLSKCR